MFKIFIVGDAGSRHLHDLSVAGIVM